MPDYTKRRGLIEALVCSAAAVITYLNSVAGGFVWDDVYLVVKNPYVKGLANVPELFTTGYWASIGETGGLYRPLTMLSFLLENSVAGTSPWLYHLDNVILHALATLLVYVIARRLLPDQESAAPLIAGLLFAVHPVHTEAVSWVSGRAELLSTVFFLSAFLAFMHPGRRVYRQEVSAGLFLLGLLCKETAATLPVFILLYVFFIRKERDITAAIKAFLPYVLVIAAYIPVRIAVLGGHVGPQSQMFGAVDTYHTFLTMAKAGFHYVRLVIVPTDLKVAYIFPPPGSILDFRIILFIAAVLLFLALSGRLYRTAPLYLFLGMWFIVTLMPVSNLIPTEVIMTERALYLPSAGVCILFGILFARVYGFHRRTGMIAAMAVIAVFAALTVSRTPVWGDDRLFQTELLEINKRLVVDFPDQPKAFTKLADSYLALEEFSKAGPYYVQALSMDPADCGAHYGLAISLKNVGRVDGALDELYKALDCGYERPSDVHGNIAAILFDMGNIQESEEHLRTATELDPYEPRHLVNMGYILQARGDMNGAIDITLRAAGMAPNDFQARFRLGMLYGGLGDFGKSVSWLSEAVALQPDNADARFYLGAAYEALGDIESARREYGAVMEKAPGHEAAGARLGNLKGG